MLSEEPKLNNSDATEEKTPSGESEVFPQQTATAPIREPVSVVNPGEDDDARPTGDVDFGQLLDQFEQEQATLQEGEVVRGTVVGISERGVVIDFGYKSEGIVNPAEFTEDGVITVKAGDEVEVLVKSMETVDGLPVLSRADAVRMKAWDDLEKAYQEGSTVKGRVMERIKGGLRIDIDGIAAF
nr:S1 RNA-binding domain-containing protein [Pyrinomonadaceae bacterium]